MFILVQDCGEGNYLEFMALCRTVSAARSYFKEYIDIYERGESYEFMKKYFHVMKLNEIEELSDGALDFNAQFEEIVAKSNVKIAREAFLMYCTPLYAEKGSKKVLGRH